VIVIHPAGAWRVEGLQFGCGCYGAATFIKAVQPEHSGPLNGREHSFEQLRIKRLGVESLRVRRSEGQG